MRYPSQSKDIEWTISMMPWELLIYGFHFDEWKMPVGSGYVFARRKVTTIFVNNYVMNDFTYKIIAASTDNFQKDIKSRMLNYLWED